MYRYGQTRRGTGGKGGGRVRSLKRYLAVLFAALSLAGTLSGCSLNLAASPEDLYALPQLPAEYAGLNNSIRQLI